MTLSPAFLDELRHRTTLSTLIGRTLKLQKAGREYKACCPFHNEKSPSFYVNDDKGFYHCFGCSAHGDAIRWMTDQRGLPFMDAVKELAQAAGMELPAMDRAAADKAERAQGLVDITEAAAAWYREQLQGLAGAEARAYLDKRGIKEATRKAFAIGFAPDGRNRLAPALAPTEPARLVEAGLLIQPDEAKREPYDRFRGRLMIPIRDQRGRTIAFGGRIIGQGEPKYLNSPETPLFDKGRTLYNLDRAGPASRKSGRVLVVEGYLDVIALDQAGIGEAVAPLGTALTEAQMERLWRLADIPILCFDGDKAGQKAALRAAIRALPLVQPGRTLRFALLPAGKDPDDLVREGGAAAFEAVLAAAISLDELVWRSELEEAGALATPEARAGLGKRLRDHARLVSDEFLQRQYLAEFNRRLYEHFDSLRSPRRFDPGQRGPGKGKGPFGRPFAPAAPPPPELRAIADEGIDRATVAAILAGLLRHPQVIARHAETLARVAIADRQLGLVQQAMLEAALIVPDLDSAALATNLRQDGLEPFLDAVRRTNLAFSFLRGNAEPERAERDLGAVIDQVVAIFEVRKDQAAATRRFMETGEEADFLEQVRLRAEERKLQDGFAALAGDDGAGL
ncbi:DNA primase [Sphingomonas naphthae]|uniref:DNA primase n=1 Tax=Sphingomonas naphthae TaxID=1813468 RepID=A0ABY7TK36_9SPHN|nr:DNA primase [Sphingomonas naphthae]WCT73593.1 DNA primase [Sphingomonas naphthae]